MTFCDEHQGCSHKKEVGGRKKEVGGRMDLVVVKIPPWVKFYGCKYNL